MTVSFFLPVAQITFLPHSRQGPNTIWIYLFCHGDFPSLSEVSSRPHPDAPLRLEKRRPAVPIPLAAASFLGAVPNT